MQTAPFLHDAIAAVAPIHGISVGSWADKTTWRIDFDPSASPAQQAAAQAALLAFDPSAPANRPVYVSTSVMLSRLTAAEYTAIMQAAAAQLSAGNGQLSHWLDMARTAAQGVNLNDAPTIAAKAALISGGLLTQARADLIFAP